MVSYKSTKEMGGCTNILRNFLLGRLVLLCIVRKYFKQMHTFKCPMRQIDSVESNSTKRLI